MASSPWPLWIAGGALVAGGLALMLWALFADRARGRRRCPKCWYDMAGLPGLLCPECGRTASDERALGRTRRWWRRATAGMLAATVGAGTLAMPVWRIGVVASTPTPVLRGLAAALPGATDRAFTRNRVRLPGAGTLWDRMLIAGRASSALAVAAAVIDDRPTTANVMLAVEDLRFACGVKYAAVAALRRIALNQPGDHKDREEALQEYAALESRSRVERVSRQIVLTDRDCFVRRRALRLFGGASASQTATIDLCIEALGKADAPFRFVVINFLADYGPVAGAAAATLERIGESDPDEIVRSAAARALLRVRGRKR